MATGKSRPVDRSADEASWLLLFSRPAGASRVVGWGLGRGAVRSRVPGLWVVPRAGQVGWSLRGDARMIGMVLSGRDAELGAIARAWLAEHGGSADD